MLITILRYSTGMTHLRLKIYYVHDISDTSSLLFKKKKKHWSGPVRWLRNCGVCQDWWLAPWLLHGRIYPDYEFCWLALHGSRDKTKIVFVKIDGWHHGCYMIVSILIMSFVGWHYILVATKLMVNTTIIVVSISTNNFIGGSYILVPMKPDYLISQDW